jgi:hypothetical protein
MVYESCAVEQDIYRSDASCQRADGARGADIERLQFTRQAFQFLAIQIGRNDAAALARKSYGSGAANTRSRRGDESSLPF